MSLLNVECPKMLLLCLLIHGLTNYNKIMQLQLKFSCYIMLRSPSIWQNPIRGHELMANRENDAGQILTVALSVLLDLWEGGQGVMVS